MFRKNVFVLAIAAYSAIASAADVAPADTAADTSASQQQTDANATSLPAVNVSASSDPSATKAYAGGQVNQNSKAGILGTLDFLDTPFNITSYTQKTIQDQQARSVIDVVQNDPSVRPVSPQTNGSEVFYIRGFAVNNQDISFNGLYGILPYWRVAVASADHIEVLKGASAFLNGMAPSGAIGGAINIVSKRADDTPLTEFTASYISGANFGGQLDVGRRFGPDNALGIRVNGVYRDGDVNRTGQQLGEGTVALDYRGRDLRLTADLGYQKLDQNKVEGLMSLATGVTNVPSPPSADNTYYQSWTYWKNDTTYGMLRGEYDITPHLTAYAAVGGRRFNDSYLFPYGFGLTSSGNFTEGFAYAQSWYHNVTAETGLRGDLDTGPVKHRFNVAVNSFQQESGTLSGTVATNSNNLYNPTTMAYPSLTSLSNIPKTAEVDLKSIAVSDTLSMWQDNVQLTLGARKQQVEINNYSATTGLSTSAYNRDAVSPAVALVVKPWNNVSLYTNYIEGLSQGATAPTTVVNAGQVFAPYKSKQYEAGVKVDFGRIASTVSVFQIAKPQGLTNTTTNVYSIDGEQRNRGIELNVFGEVSKNVRILGGGMLLDAVQTATAGGATDGKTATNSPHVTINLGSEWDTPLLAGLTLNARAVYTSSAYIDAANTQSIPGWTRYDAGARYAFKAGNTPVTLRFSIENLLNRTYWMSSSLYRGNPRTFLASATFSF